MRKNGKTNAVGRGGALLRPAECSEFLREFAANPQAVTSLDVGGSCEFAEDSRKNGAFCRADVYRQAADPHP